MSNIWGNAYIVRPYVMDVSNYAKKNRGAGAADMSQTLLGHREQEKGVFSGVGMVLLDAGVSLNMAASLPRASQADLRKCLEYSRM